MCGQICYGMLGGEFIVVKLSAFPQDCKVNSAEDCLEEGRILKKIPSHPHIVQYISDFKVQVDHGILGCFENVHVLLMEKLCGGDMFDFLDSNGRLDEATARRYFIQMLAALKHIHKSGFCHLDMSLENILLSSDLSTAKLCDFGQAKKIPDDEAWTCRRGKKKFMAPEIVNLDNVISGASCDLYSLGVVLFCMLTGAHPYNEPSLSDLGFTLVMYGDMEILLELHELETCNCPGLCLKPKEHHLSQSALDILSGLICPQEHRLALEMVEKHPWIWKG
jgi:serine/threonine protein kinase